MSLIKRLIISSSLITLVSLTSPNAYAVETVKTGISRLTVWPNGHLIVDLQDTLANLAFNASTCSRQDAGQVSPTRANYDQLYSTLHTAFAMGKEVKVNYSEIHCFGGLPEIHTVHMYNN